MASNDPAGAEHSWLGLDEDEGAERAVALRDWIVEQTAALVSAPSVTHAANAAAMVAQHAEELVDLLEFGPEDDEDLD